MAGIVPPGLPCHVTQRGNRLDSLLACEGAPRLLVSLIFSGGDYMLYRDLLAEAAVKAGGEV